MHRLNQTVDVVVYRLTIANSVEERIFKLQEQKRALAEATIEGKAVAKLSLKDIMNLFKHDAEHTWQNDKKDEGIGARSRVLLESSSQSAGSGSISQSTAPTSRFSSPPAAADDVRRAGGGKGRVVSGGMKGRGNEDAVYGRRW